MSRRSVLVALAAACVGLLAYACWPQEPPAPLAPEHAAAPRADAPIDPTTGDGIAGGERAAGAAPTADTRIDLTPADAPKHAPLPPHDPAFVWIEVRDDRERPVPNVPVGLRVDEGRRSLLRWRGATGSDGRVRAPNVTTTTEARDATAWAMLALPLASGTPVQIERARPPRAPIVLHLPPCGSVDVGIVGDALFGAGADVRLRVFADAQRGDAFVADVQAPVERGHAQFAFVGLGLRLEAEGTRPGQNEPSRLVFDGPRAAGQQQFVQLSLLPKGATMITARVEDERGQPVRSARLDYTTEGTTEHGTSSSNSAIETGDDAVMRIVLDDRLGADAARTLSLRWSTGGDVQSVKTDLPRPLPPGENDLGTLRLQRPPLVCAGLVLDSAGKPIAGAEVRVARQQEIGGRSEWRGDMGLQTTTSIDGVFTVRGTADALQLRAEVEAAGYLPLTTEPFAPATAGLRIQLAHAAALTGSVVLAPPLDEASVLVELHRGDSSAPTRLARRDERGLFEFSSLMPGTVEVRIRAIGDLAGELRVPDVVLREGETTRDPRLQDVDLLKGMQAIAFTVVDQTNTPLRDAMVFVVDGTAQQTRFEGLLLPHGKGRLLTHGSSVEVIAVAPGAAWGRGVLTDGTALRLPPPFELHLRLAGDVRLQPGETLAAQLSPLDPMLSQEGEYMLYSGLSATRSGTGTLPWATGVTARAVAGEAVAELGRPGRYRLRWLLQREGGTEYQLGPARELTVDDAPTTLRDAGVRAADLEAARKR